MTLIPLNYKNFVKNKINNTVKIEYTDSDLTTHVYDNNIDSKSILNTERYSDVTKEEVGVSNNSELEAIKLFNNRFVIWNQDSSRFLNDFANSSNQTLENYANQYFYYKDILINENANVNNDNLKSFLYRNSYGIERIEQKFLPQSFELQKKNYVKNNLYKAYQEDFSLDFYNNLEFGFCNWNSINFFSQRYSTDTNHTNCIIWPNTKINSSDKKHQYDFIYKSNFNLSFYFNLRKDYNNTPKSECVFHIPDVISIYFLKSYLSNPVSYRVAIVLGNKTKKNLSDISGISFLDNNTQTLENSVYVSSDLNILNNRWYNFSLNNFFKTDSSRDIDLYIDGSLRDSFSLSNIVYESANDIEAKNSFICVGNKPKYENNTNYEHVFYQAFARSFDKDISLGKNNIWQATGNEVLDVSLNSYTGDITFEKSVAQNSESFHGEIHDIRVYKNTLDEEKILDNCNSTINNVLNEITNYNLQFYIPVHYIPSYSNRRSSFNATLEKVNLRYDCLYNPILSNTCGGLEVSCENYLIDFVNHAKPNVIIGGTQLSYIYEDNNSNSINSLINNSEDSLKIKKGVFAQSIYNSNFNNIELKRNANLDHNLSYRNLLILPNDNGIQTVRFDSIKELLGNSSEENNISYDIEKYNLESFNSDKPFNISVENIFNKSYFNKSISLDANVDNTNTTFDLFENNVFWFGQTIFSIKTNDTDFEDFSLTQDSAFNCSNIIFHDTRITNFDNVREQINESNIGVPNLGNPGLSRHLHWIKLIDDCLLRIYPITESNPIIRNYKQLLNSTGIDSSDLQSQKYKLEYNDTEINYLKLPIPYSVLNKDLDSLFINIFDISSKMYNKSIKKRKFNILDDNLSTSNNNLNLKISDNGSGILYRNNCLTKVATWNYLGHIFYKDGVFSLNRPELFYFGENDFKADFETDSALYTHEINIPVESGLFDKSVNESYNADLRHDESAFNSEDSFVYITDINLHDENLNVVARAKLARPAPKKKSDSILFRLKMDY